ncbi:MAG: TetR/AcrR family transcriptional regulator [Desulfatitalea sp.]|nr:TetR/AcrR family transcriptional regulator [Desulfatitalea sp.]NNJ98871.1 TetR/AcrR family transcriptional regulator [Desulfatitalea sp.]
MNDTKKRILEAAEELLSKKGASDTTIAEIARKANVVDSHAYQYFKGKKGLVFGVAEERLKASVALLKEQLQGILDPKSRLGKFIWHGLHYNDSHRDYVRNLMFDYRSNVDFYKTPAYGLVREHAKVCGDILKQGITAGVFHDQIDYRLVREIIYGTLDSEAISCVLVGEISNTADDWHDILTILLDMISTPKREREADKKLSLIETAERVFAKYGFDKSTISQIAKHAGVAEGTIYDYFKNKDDLLFSISDHRLGELNRSLTESFEITTPVRKLRRFLRLHFSMFTKNRDFLKVYVVDSLLNRKFYSSNAFALSNNYQNYLVDILEEGKSQGIFREKLNTRVYRNMFFGTFIHLALRWLFFEDKPFDKMREVDAIIDLFAEAAVAPLGADAQAQVE